MISLNFVVMSSFILLSLTAILSKHLRKRSLAVLILLLLTFSVTVQIYESFKVTFCYFLIHFSVPLKVQFSRVTFSLEFHFLKPVT